jgi:malonate transporter MadL subunit
MTMSGVALLAICTLLGQWLGDVLGELLGVKANVGGVGIAMILLIASRLWLERHHRMSGPASQGIAFWGALYIPIVVAMAAQQDVVAAVEGGSVVLIAGAGSLLLCFAVVALLSRLSPATETMDEIEARERSAEVAPLPTPAH